MSSTEADVCVRDARGGSRIWLRVRQGIYGSEIPHLGPGASLGREPGDEFSQKLVIFCKLYCSDILCKKAKQYFINLAFIDGGFVQ